MSVALDCGESSFGVDVDGKIVARYEDRLSELAGAVGRSGGAVGTLGRYRLGNYIKSRAII